MARALPEWIGSSPDVAVPERVRDRILLKHSDACAECRVRFGPKNKAEFDHIQPLILGGPHSEANLQPLCRACHSAKSRADVATKAKVASVRKTHFGLKPPSRTPVACGRRSPWKKTVDGRTVRRDA